MAIPQVLTRGYGNGTFDGTIPLVLLRGHGAAILTASTVQVVEVDVSIGQALCASVNMTQTFSADTDIGITSAQCSDMSVTIDTDASFSLVLNRKTDT
tara:strand:+ start:181 stop:474 length:294 start_codon:yes stop_codon:yes gene_type:complete